MTSTLAQTTCISLLYSTLSLVLCPSSWSIQAQGCPATPPVSPPWLDFPSQPFHHEALTPFGPQSARVYVMDLGGELGRPFVFVEGIDFGLDNSEDQYRLGDFGWQAFQGCDLGKYPMLESMPILLDSLVMRGFHPVLIDFHEGAGNILHNAALVADILVHLREHRTDPRPMVVSGASMGGQIARIALAQMEAEGEAHCAQLYLSLDSPHTGANVPLGLQQMIAFLTSGEAGMSGLAAALMAPAARQLLLEHHIPSYTRTDYQQFLDSTGWPQSCRNAAIANGSLESVGNANVPLLDYEYTLLPSELFGDIGGLLDLEIHPFPGDADHDQAAPLAPVSCWAETPQGSGWPWPLVLDAGFGIPSSHYGPWSLDLMPGGTRPSIGQFVDAFNTALEELDTFWPISIPLIETDQYQTLHSFIPTPSALGIGLPWTISTLDNLTSLSPFDAIHVGEGNEPHSEINSGNSTFVLSQLDLTECPLAPGVLMGDAVLNETGDWNLPSLQVSGRLCLQSADSVFGSQAAPPSSSGSFTLNACSGTLLVTDSGHLELGGGLPPLTSHAQLTLSSGSQLEVKGTLTLHENSILILEEGSELIIDGGFIDQRMGSQVWAHSGSIITASDAVTWIQSMDSELHLNGHCQLLDHSEWMHHLSPSSRIHVPELASFHLGLGARMVQKALSSDTQWILANQAEIEIIGEGEWRHQKVGIRMLGASSWLAELSSGMEFESSIWWGAEGDSLRFSGPLHLSEHQAQSVHIHHSLGTYRLTGSSFTGGSTEMDDNRIRWTGSRFLHHPVVHTALSSSPSHLIETCSFEAVPTALELYGPGRIRIEDSQFVGNGTGLSTRQARIEVQCTDLNSNDVGISTHRGLLVLCPEGGGGWNRFDNNDVHMTFHQAQLPAIQNGANHFGNFYSGWASGSLNIPCSAGSITWDISGQSWDWPAGWTQIQGGLWAVNPNGPVDCPISAIDLNPILPETCRAREKKQGE